MSKSFITETTYNRRFQPVTQTNKQTYNNIWYPNYVHYTNINNKITTRLTD